MSHCVGKDTANLQVWCKAWRKTDHFDNLWYSKVELEIVDSINCNKRLCQLSHYKCWCVPPHNYVLIRMCSTDVQFSKFYQLSEDKSDSWRIWTVWQRMRQNFETWVQWYFLKPWGSCTYVRGCHSHCICQNCELLSHWNSISDLRLISDDLL